MSSSARYAALVLGASLTALGASMTSTGCGASGSSETDLDASRDFDGQTSGFVPNDGAPEDSSFDPDAACATTKISAKRAPANILFIVDRSKSMLCNPPPTTTSQACEATLSTANPSADTKWTITKAALESAIGAMPPEDSAGLTYFSVDDDCAVQDTPNVPVAPITPQHLTLLAQSLDNVGPDGNTPIIGGVTLGYKHLDENTFVGRRFLVLITDGQETCAPASYKDTFLQKTVPEATAVGIKTFVIGAPGSEPARSFLSRIAWLGGTAKSPTCIHDPTPPDLGDCHFDLTDSALDLTSALGQALEKVSKEALTCEYELPLPGEGGTLDFGKVNVIFEPGTGAQQVIPRDSAKGCNESDGWQYSADGRRIVLCGPSCEAVKADTSGSVSIALGCVTQVR